jgi:hypothetical protein
MEGKMNPFTQHTKKTIKQAIEWYELCSSGLRQQNGAYTVAKKIRYMTGKAVDDNGIGVIGNNMLSSWFVVYDITLANDLNKHSEWFGDCYIAYDTIKNLLIAIQGKK